MAGITIEDLHTLVVSSLVGQGVDQSSARSMADEFVAAEIAGTKTHGVTKVVSLNLGNLRAEPTLNVSGSLVSVDGRGANGFILFTQLATAAVQVAAKQGVCLIFARNFSRYSGLYPYTEQIAASGYIGILMNSAGPAAVAPHGGIDPITGTNPIAFSFPTVDGPPQTFDFSTAAVVWGAIRQAAVEGKLLPAHSFLDAAGGETRDPTQVNAVRAFGGPKGFALNLAIELLCGAAGGLMGGKVESEFDLGAVLVAIDPAAAGSARLAEDATALFEEIRISRPEAGQRKVHVPGDRARGRRLLEAVSGDHTLEIPDVTLEYLGRMARGESVQDLSSNPLFN